MPIPQNKAELQIAIEIEFSKLKTAIELIPNNEILSKSLAGHKKESLMSAHNLISYLLGWGLLVEYWIENRDNSEDIIFPHPEFKWTQLGDLAQRFYKDFEPLSFDQLNAKLVKNNANILNFIKRSNDLELYQNLFYKAYPLGRMIQLNTSSPYKNARLRIKKFVKALNNK